MILQSDNPLSYDDNGELPSEPPYVSIDADTLGGKPASDYMLKSDYSPVDLTEYLKESVADTKYAVINHNHDGVYSPVSHTHTTGQISGLDTSINSINSEISSLKTSVSNGKSAVASAITDKGVSTSATASFDTMAVNIQKIVTGITVNGNEGEYTVANNNNITAGDFVQVYDQQLFNKVTESGPFDTLDVYTGTEPSPHILPYDDTHVIAIWAHSYGNGDANIQVYVRMLTITPNSITASKKVYVQTDIYDTPTMFSYYPSACYTKLTTDKIIVTGYNHNYLCIIQINNPLSSNLSLSAGNAVRFGNDDQCAKFTFRISDTKFAKLANYNHINTNNILYYTVYTVDGTTIAAATSGYIQSNLATKSEDETYSNTTYRLFLQLNGNHAVYVYNTTQSDEYNHVYTGINYAYLSVNDNSISLVSENEIMGPIHETGNIHPQYVFYILGAGLLPNNKFAILLYQYSRDSSPNISLMIYNYNNTLTLYTSKDMSNLDLIYSSINIDPLICEIYSISDNRFILQYLTTTGTIIKSNYQLIEIDSNKNLNLIGNAYQLDNNYMSNTGVYDNRPGLLCCIPIADNNIILPYFYFNQRSNLWYDISISSITYHIFDKFVEPYNSGSSKQFGIANENGNTGSVISVTTP